MAAPPAAQVPRVTTSKHISLMRTNPTKGQLFTQLSQSGIDPRHELKDRMRNRPKSLTDGYVPGAASKSSQSQLPGETALPPEIVELQRQLLDTEQDVSQLMAEIMEETVQVEMATANAELASLKNEISNLKQRLGEA